MNISLSEATSIVDRAISHADSMGVPMNIAVVDGGGHLIAFARMDKAVLGSIDIALAKAKPRSCSTVRARTYGSTASRAALPLQLNTRMAA
jgi:uncharacterized protein GlcG (DUF336 family)